MQDQVSVVGANHMKTQNAMALLETLYSEPDFNKWQSFMAGLHDRWPDQVQRVKMILDRGPLECKSFETFSPRLNDPIGFDVGTKYLGAWINNAAMTWGCRNVFLSREVYGPVTEMLKSRYSQVFRMLQENFGPDCGVWPIDESPQFEPRAAKKRSRPTLAEASVSPIVGIDIGNTSIKAVVVQQGRVVFRERTPTFPYGVKSLEALQTSFSTALARAKDICDHPGSVGIAWFGDVRDGRPLMQAADLGEIAAKEDESRIQNWLDNVTKKSTVPVSLYGDSQALGIALPVLWPQSKAYIMIFGTSMGGAYVNADGEYEDGISLVARVVVNMAEDALPHASTQVRGVLQRYIASRGILAAVESLSRSAEHTWLADLQVDKEAAGLLLQQWLASDDPRQRSGGRAIVRQVSRWLAAGVVTITTYYDVEVFGLAGTPMQGEVGPAIVQATREAIHREYRRSDVQVRLAPFDLVFGGAIGAAYGAAVGSDEFHLYTD